MSALGPAYRYFTAKLGLFVDTISEYTAAAGVTIDGVKLKDSSLGVAGTPVPICGDTKYLSVSFVYGEATPLDCAFFVANRAMKVESIIVRPLVVGSDGGAVSTLVKKAPSGTAANAGTSLHASGSFDLKGTINTNQAATLSGTASDLLLAAGDALCLDTTGTMTAARGVITVHLVPV